MVKAENKCTGVDQICGITNDNHYWCNCCIRVRNAIGKRLIEKLYGLLLFLCVREKIQETREILISFIYSVILGGMFVGNR